MSERWITVRVPEPKSSPANVEIEYDAEFGIWVPRGIFPWNRAQSHTPTDSQPNTDTA